jgi:hypothetical protein
MKHHYEKEFKVQGQNTCPLHLARNVEQYAMTPVREFGIRITKLILGAFII